MARPDRDDSTPPTKDDLIARRASLLKLSVSTPTGKLPIWTMRSPVS
jgi:hypothetical protein